ncbi:NADH-FMN oxidoreductase RutF, flavin reductase (DIM6/NTAB) family [Cyclobacterium lianum]|uniref:NADH-FMN oxidoreductase RutF, flavin reductase (DIM6/NTAB) family n=1 Tax=Cyclobacterium lianum TaxID=388280 RepID=A0A1M7QDQ9_9BACT|nr:flavin reductase family protein [Cyclobacterium lianum]SHN28716.1 NADH-FMN oxidoreductase RutF, flavin reductase (DIM6/NTAB) family [Cyclobacterium lianum]
MKHFDRTAILEADKDFRRDFINCLSGYKSLNLIGTINPDTKETNLAPFSQVFHVGANPPLVGILFRPHSVERHTLENILQNKCFTLNHVSPSFYKAAHQSSARWERSEFAATGMQEAYLDNFEAPYVAESPLKVGCRLADHLTLSINETVLVIGSIEHVYVERDEALGEDGFIDLEKLGTVASSGIDAYHTGRKLARLAYAKPDQPVKEI